MTEYVMSMKTRNCMQSTLYFCMQNPTEMCVLHTHYNELCARIHLIPEEKKLMISTIACEINTQRISANIRQHQKMMKKKERKIEKKMVRTETSHMHSTYMEKCC